MPMFIDSLFHKRFKDCFTSTDTVCIPMHMKQCITCQIAPPIQPDEPLAIDDISLKFSWTFSSLFSADWTINIDSNIFHYLRSLCRSPAIYCTPSFRIMKKSALWYCHFSFNHRNILLRWLPISACQWHINHGHITNTSIHIYVSPASRVCFALILLHSSSCYVHLIIHP